MKSNDKIPELSIIIPFAGEYPQILFTIQSLAYTLRDKINFEIIAVDNNCQELQDQWSVARAKAARHLNNVAVEKRREIFDDDIVGIVNMIAPMIGQNKSGEAIKASVRGNKWLRYIRFDDRLSHWECKRRAVIAARADTLLFMDAHCIASNGIAEMFRQYTDGYDNISSFHMPLTYKILEWHRLIYKMVIKDHFYGYSFTGFPAIKDAGPDPVEVPCMSTCGMMISKKVYNRVGGWPTGLGAYGGGENFMNYALSVTGHSKFIYPGVTLHHHGDRRDYHYQYDTTLWNRLVAHYLFGGKKALYNLHGVSKGNPVVLGRMVSDILTNVDYQHQRSIIKDNTTINLVDWVKSWEK